MESDKQYTEVPREEWRWKLIIRQPDFVPFETVEKVRQELIKKKKIKLVNEVKLEKMKEKKCVQKLHIGPYSIEPELIAKNEKTDGRGKSC